MWWLTVYLPSLVAYAVGAIYILRYLIHFIIYSINWPTKVSDITSKCVLITGCDHGLGLATLRHLQRLRCVVFAACLTEEGCQRIRNEFSTNVHPIRMDITDKQSVKDAKEFIDSFLLTNSNYLFWGVVNIAGILNYNLFGDWDNVDDISATMNVNYLGTVRVTKAFLSLLKAFKGRLINTTSGITVIGKCPLFSAYGASKAATRFYTETLRIELGLHWGVSVHEICPGGLATPMTSLDTWNKMRERSWNRLDHEIREQYGEQMYRKTVTSDTGASTKTLTKKVIATEGCSDDLEPFMASVEHALFAKYPKSRYLIANAYPWMYIMGMLPDVFCDWIWKKIMQHRYGLPVATRKPKDQ